jgi:AcrR family transcriptional regulator
VATTDASIGVPRRADAARNRDRLVAAAREVFERDGYVRARITDISAAAGLAHGSFFSHFRGKDDVLAAVLGQIEDEMLHPGPSLASPGSNVVARIEAANRAYLEAYQRHASLMALLEQLATVDDAFLRIRLERTRAFVDRNARLIRDLQRDGHADPELDPDITAVAISSMVSRTAYATFVLGWKSVELDRLIDTLTRLWVNALRIPRAARRRANT